ncbi:MAG: hypothetical protein FWE48_06020 [Coriobacteriia bacterium]|nr:hypothetical protein [Coriobacteriia bacterium]MCL2746623.1 hypothetical protein [Coriobacteriia bacterium]MCL2870037.1 hypothetical protein [Coriobacteriia bacterium]
MKNDKKLAFIVAALALIIALSVATVAVAQGQIQQRECYAAGCRAWESCDQGPGCPRFLPEPGQGSACSCC